MLGVFEMEKNRLESFSDGVLAIIKYQILY